MLETDDGDERVHDTDVKTAPDEIDNFVANNKHKKSLIFKIEKTEEDGLDATSNSNFNEDVVEQTILIKTEADESRNEYGNQDMETIDSLESKASGKKPEKLKFSCKKCSFKTTAIAYLRRHYKRTHIEIISQQLVDFTCNKCDFVTKDRKEFDDHLTIHLDSPSKNENQQNLSFKCDKCDKIFKNKAHLESHLVSHSDVRPFQCDKCNFKAKTKFVFKKHQLVHKDKSEVQMYSCSKCDYVTKYRYNLQDHQLRHVDMSELKTTFECKLCNYVAKFKTQLKQHEIVHKDCSESYKCDFCEFVTKQRRTIVAHVRKHHNIKRYKSETNESGGIIENVGFSLSIDPLYPYQCDKCNFNAKYESSLKEHLLTHSATECDDDERPFMAKTDLSEIDKTFPCDKCEYVGKRKQALKEHEWIHKDSSELEIIKCQLCSYVTTRPHSLLAHKRRCHKPKLSNTKMSNDDRLSNQYKKCNECTYTTKYKSHLNKHQEVKHKRTLKCDKCSFEATRDIIKKHQLLVHKESKLFPCDQCPYVAKCGTYFRRHMEIHKQLGVDKLKCDKCDFTTSIIPYLKKHYKRVHKKTLPTAYNNFINNSMFEDVKNSGFQNESNKIIIQDLNKGSTVYENDDDHESTLDIKFNDLDTTFDKDIKVKVEKEEDSVLSVEINTSILKVENNYPNSRFVSGLTPDDINTESKEDLSQSLNSKLFVNDHNTNNIIFSDEQQVFIKNEISDDTFLPD